MKQIFCFLLFIVLLLDYNFLLAQGPIIEWQKCLGGSGGDYAHSIEPTADGGYIVAGYSFSNNGGITNHHGSMNFSDYWIVKLSSIGNIQWQKSIGGSLEDKASAIHQTPDGGYIVAGSTLSSDGDVTGVRLSMDYWLLKLSINGTVEWQKSMGGSRNDYCYSVELTNDGGYILAGDSESNDGDVSGNHGNRDYWIVKVNSTGNIQWQKSLGGSGVDEGRSVKPTADGGYIVTGNSESNDGDVTNNHGDLDYWVVKLTSTGNLEWQKSLGGSNVEWSWSINQAVDGGYVVAGRSRSDNGDINGHHGPATTDDFWIVKLTGNGIIQWEKSLGGYYNECAFSISLTKDGGFIIAGSAESVDGDITCPVRLIDYWIVKLNGSGIMEWQKIIGGSYFDEAYSIRQTPDGGYIVAGFTGSPEINGYHPDFGMGVVGDYWIIKLSNQIIIPAIPDITINNPPANICSGSTVTLTASLSIAVSNPVYQWQKNGINVGNNSSSYSSSDFANGDINTCVLFYDGTCDKIESVLSNSIVMDVSTAIQPTISINANNTSICSGTSVTFTALTINGGANPVFQWKLNGNNTGINSSQYVTNSLNNGDIISCQYSDNTACFSGTNIISNLINIQVIPNSSPTVSISVSNNNICLGSQVMFTATAANSGVNPNYQWKINGINAGTNNATITTSDLLNGDVVNCIVTTDPNLLCTSAKDAVSNNIVMVVVTALNPSINIIASDNNVCSGTNVNFTAITENAGVSPSYQWKLNNATVGSNASVYSSNTLRNGDQLSCTLLPDNTSCSNSVTSSNILTMIVNELPVIYISPADTSLAPGSRIKLNASTSGTSYSYSWSPADKLVDPFTLSPNTIPLTANTTYTLNIVSDKGCNAYKQATIRILRPLYMPNAFTPNNDGINDIFRIPLDVSLLLNEFSIYNRWGNKIFTTSNLNKGWDGTKNGAKLDAGVYIYAIKGVTDKGPVFLRGSVLLIR